MAALACAVPPAARADLLPRYEENGRALCAGRPGLRFVHGALPDGDGGTLLVTNADLGPYGLHPLEGYDIFLGRYDRDLVLRPTGDGLYATDPCGALVYGGRDDQYIESVARSGPDRFHVAGVTSSLELIGTYPSEEQRVFVQGFDFEGNRLPFSTAGLPAPQTYTAHPRLAPDGQGGLFLMWTEFRPDAVPLFGQVNLIRLAADGTPLWPAPVRLSGDEDILGFEADLQPDGGGGAYATWREAITANGVPAGYGARVQRVGADGTPLWGAGGLRPCDCAGEQSTLRLASLGDEGVLILISTRRMRLQKMSGAGAWLWGAEGLGVSDPEKLGDAQDGRILPGPDGSLYVAWEEQRSTEGHLVLARRLLPDGRFLWPGEARLRARVTPLLRSRPALLPDGSLAVVWEDRPLEKIEDPLDLYLNVVDRRGRVKGPPAGLPIATNPGWQVQPEILPIPPGGTGAPGEAAAGLQEILIFWSDGPYLESGTAGYALRAQRLAVHTSPRLDAATPVPLLQEESVTLLLTGDDLQPGLRIEAGAGLIVEEASVEAIDPEGPGDLLRLRLRADRGAPPGGRDLIAVNPDGGTVALAGFLSVNLSPRRVDVDRSGRADGVDLAALARAFGRASGEERYDPGADIDLSGLVDGADLALLAARFGEPIP
jgi:hypothetical protein